MKQTATTTHPQLERIDFTRAQKQMLKNAGIAVGDIDYGRFRKSPNAKGSLWADRLRGSSGSVVILALTQKSAIAGISMVIPAEEYDAFASSLQDGSLRV